MTSSDVFFIFSKFWFIGLLGGRGGGNRVENGPKRQKAMSHSVSQELYLIWLCFVVHVHTCKMMISPAIIFLFSKVWFSRFFKVHQWMARKFRGVPHLLHMCVIFYKVVGFVSKNLIPSNVFFNLDFQQFSYVLNVPRTNNFMSVNVLFTT